MFLLLPAEDFHSTVVRFIIRVRLPTLATAYTVLIGNVRLLGVGFLSCYFQFFEE